MKKIIIYSIILFALNVTSAATEYWFNTDGSRENKFSLSSNWFNIWPGGTNYHNMGNTPADVVDATIRFQTKQLNMDIEATLQSSNVFSTDKVSQIYGQDITIKNLESAYNNNVTIARVTSANGSFQIDNNLKLLSNSTSNTTYFQFITNNANDMIINGNISVISEKKDDKYVRYEDDLLKVRWDSTTSTSNVIFNGAIDLTRYTSDTSSWAARLNVLGSNNRTSALSSPYVYLGGAESNNMSIKLNDRAHLALGKMGGAIAANQLEMRGNSAVSFFQNYQVKTNTIRAIDARVDLAHEGGEKYAKTAAFLNLNATEQEFNNIAFEWDQWQGGSADVIRKGTNQYVRIDFSEHGDSFVRFTSSSNVMDMSGNLARDPTNNTKLTTDDAKLNNRINAQNTGIIISNFTNYDMEKGTGDLMLFNSDKINLDSSIYYDDIELISKELVDHIWLAEGERGVDYTIELGNYLGSYMLIINYIPEPSSIASVFGIFALFGTFALRRKNK